MRTHYQGTHDKGNSASLKFMLDKIKTAKEFKKFISLFPIFGMAKNQREWNMYRAKARELKLIK